MNRKIAVTALLGVLGFASLVAYDNSSYQGSYGQAGSYQQDSSQGGHYQDGSQGYYQGGSQASGQQYYSDHSNDNSSEALGARVLSALQKDNTLSTPRNIQVTAYNGDVTLTGTVRSDAEKSKIETIAHQVSGVKNVTNKVTVKK